jgi:hypothetical protein
MKKIKLSVLLLVALSLVITASNCKKPAVKQDKNPNITLDFEPYFATNPLILRSSVFTKTDGELIKIINWSILLSKVSLIKSDNSKVLLGDGYVWIDFYALHNKFKYENLPAGSYKGISIEFGIDSAVNHGDPNVWAANHPLNPNLTGMHWSWAGGYIFQVLDGNYKENKDSTNWKVFSYHTVGDVFVRNYTLNLNFDLPVNTNKTASIQLAVDEFFKTPTALKIADEPNNHSGSKTEINWMQKMVENASDVYQLIKVE